MKLKHATNNDQAHPLAHLIPDAMFADTYVGRKIGKVDDLVVMDKAFEARHNVLIMGPTGSAKTSMVYAFAAKRGLPVVNVPCNGAAEPRQIIGGWTPTPEGGFDFVPGDATLAVEHGGIIYLDEVNMTPAKILAFIHGLLDRRRTLNLPEASGSSYPTMVQAHKDCFVVGACNPGYEGTRPLNAAFKNRFAIKLQFPYDKSVEKKLVESVSLLEAANKLRDAYVNGTLSSTVSTNMLLEFEELILDMELPWEFAVENFAAAFEPQDSATIHDIFKLFAERIKGELYEEAE